MHFSVEAKVRGCLCIATKGSLYGDQCRLFGVFTRDVAVIIMVLSTVGWQYLYRSEVALELERHS